MSEPSSRPGWRPEWQRKKRGSPGAKQAEKPSEPEPPREPRPKRDEEDGHPPPKPRTVEELRDRIAYLNGIRLPLVHVAAAIGVSIESLRTPGRTLAELFAEMQRNLETRADLVETALGEGAAWVCEQVAARAFKAALNETIPRMHYSKCHLGFRETGEVEGNKKPQREITQVRWLTEDGADERGGGGQPGSAGAESDGAAAGVGMGAVSGDSRGPRRGEELDVRGSAARADGAGSEPERGVHPGSSEKP